MGRRIQTDRSVARITATYVALFSVVIVIVGLAAFGFVARVEADALRPILDLPDGAAAYRTALLHAALSIALAALALTALLAPVAYVLARVSLQPLVVARERERRFSADAAHELRTPLARIASVAQAARGDGDDPRDAALATITRVALDAGDLVGDLLMLSQAETLPEVAREPLDIIATIASIVADRAGTNLRLEVTASGDAFVLGERTLVTRMIANVIENASRYATTRIDVIVRVDEAQVRIIVRDDGPGVPDELRERIFERFVRGPGSGGTGLGLPLARWIARAHGGDLHNPERATFEIALPRAPI